MTLPGILLASAQAVFVPLPPADSTSSEVTSALGINASATVVAGGLFSTGSDPTQPLVWRGERGTEMLELLPGSVGGAASACTADGNTLVGWAEMAGGDAIAVQWTSAGPPTPVTIPGDAAEFRDVNADGTFAIGFSTTGTGPREAFRWGPAGLDWLGNLPNQTGNNLPTAISDDGQVVIGATRLGANDRAYLWTAANGLTNLGVLGDAQPGLRASAAYALSGDGQVVGGVTSTPGGFVPFRWTSSTGMVAVGPISTFSFFASVNGWDQDGSHGVGVINTATSGAQAGFFQGNQQGTPLRDHALALGAPALDGWTFSNAFAISSDGSVVAGRGLDPAGRVRSFLVDLDGTSVPELGSTTCATVPNSAGSGAHLRALGSRIVDGNELRLHCDGLPSGQFVMFINGTQANNQPIGSGQDLLCVGGLIGRYGRPGEIQQANSHGAAALDLDLTDTPSSMATFSVMAGQSLHFQAWYRDVDPTPTFHLSNGTVVPFL